MKKICYMMIGIPGTGKSTLSNQLIKEMPNLEVVSTDIYIEKKAKESGKTYAQTYREVGEDAQKWMNNYIRQLTKKEKSFIWDQTNVVASSRKKKMSFLKQNKYEVIAIAIKLSDDELNKRLNKRTLEGGKKIGLKIIQDMINNYQEPHYDEGFIEIYTINDTNDFNLVSKNDIKTKIV